MLLYMFYPTKNCCRPSTPSYGNCINKYTSGGKLWDNYVHQSATTLKPPTLPLTTTNIDNFIKMQCAAGQTLGPGIHGKASWPELLTQTSLHVFSLQLQSLLAVTLQQDSAPWNGQRNITESTNSPVSNPIEDVPERFQYMEAPGWIRHRSSHMSCGVWCLGPWRPCFRHIPWMLEARSMPWAFCKILQAIPEQFCGVTESIVLLEGHAAIRNNSYMHTWFAMVFG